MTIQGFVEEIRPDFVRGWASTNSRLPLRLDLVVEDAVIATTMTGIQRGDVARKLGLDISTGFEFHLDLRKSIAAEARVEVIDQASRFALPFTNGLRVQRALTHQLAKSVPTPSVPARPLKLLPKLIGWEIEDGWIVGRGRVGEDCQLRVLVDGYAASTITLRGSVAQAPVADFALKIPLQWHDGLDHEVSIVTAMTALAVPSFGGKASVRFRAEIAGEIESINHGCIRGWIATDSTDMTTLSLFDDATHRADLALPSGENNGVTPQRRIFDLPIPAVCFTGRTVRFRLRATREGHPAVGLTLHEHRHLDLTLDPAELARSPVRYRIKIEQATPHALVGWAMDRHAPFAPVRLDIFVDGLRVGDILADHYRPRFRVLGGAGQYGFSFPIPSALWDGAQHVISCRPAGMLGDVAGPSAQIEFPYRVLHPAPPSLHEKSIKRPDAAIGQLVSLVVINRNGAELLDGLLRSVARHLAHRPIEIIIVDHGSSDSSKDVAASFTNCLLIRFIDRGQNFSFSESNNLGADLSRGEHILFVNNDIEFTGDVLGLMQAHFVDPDVGMVGIRLFEPRNDASGTDRLHLHHDQVTFRVSVGQPASYEPFEVEENYAPVAAGPSEVAAVTAALMMMRRCDFLALSGFDERYFYGLEDIDLCLRLTAELGKKIVVERAAEALHRRGATRGKRLPTLVAEPAGPDPAPRNMLKFQASHARTLRRLVRRGLPTGQAPRLEKLRIGFAVTSIDLKTAAGDTFTAAELAAACSEQLGWETALLRHDATDARGLDAYVAMRPDAPVRLLTNANPGLVTVAWIRNRANEWLAAGMLDCYRVLLASSTKIVEFIRKETGRDAILFPIATNTARFGSGSAQPTRDLDIVFTGNFWGDEREALQVAREAGIGEHLTVFGYGWERAAEPPSGWRGPRRYGELADIYARAKLVIDDGHHVTRDWNSLNSRVFDALAAGALVLTNTAQGAQALFGPMLPCFETPKQLRMLVDRYLEEPDLRHDHATRLQTEVREKHSYAVRAMALRSTLTKTANELSIAIKCPVPRKNESDLWGDWHFALALRHALVRLGHPTRIDILPEWQTGLSQGDDVTITLRGLSRYKPQFGSINLLWLISHPTTVEIDELRGFDHVYVASEMHARTLAQSLPHVEPLLQCTDPLLFRPDHEATEDNPDGVLFVGNSRGQRRPILDAAIAAGLMPRVFGSSWRGLIDECFLVGEYIPNTTLSAHYAAATVVLNDHWPDMRELGFLSNRLFDAVASGAAVVSDPVAGLEAIFGKAVLTCSGPDELRDAIEYIRARDGSDARWRLALADTIRSEHSFDARARIISAKVGEIARSRVLKRS